MKQQYFLPQVSLKLQSYLFFWRSLAFLSNLHCHGQDQEDFNCFKVLEPSSSFLMLEQPNIVQITFLDSGLHVPRAIQFTVPKSLKSLLTHSFMRKWKWPCFFYNLWRSNQISFFKFIVKVPIWISPSSFLWRSEIVLL